MDGSTASRAALWHAVELARRWGAGLHVLHVRRAVRRAIAPFAPPPATLRTHASDAAQVAEWIAEAHEVLTGDISFVERKGSVAQEIVRYAQEAGCEVIVLGTQRRHGLSRLLVGSVAEAVVRNARCPVLVVPTVTEVQQSVPDAVSAP